MDKRIEKLKKIQEEKKTDAVLINTQENIYYFSGFTGSDAQILMTKEANYLITDFRYLDQAMKEAPFFQIIKRNDTYAEAIAGILPNSCCLGLEEKNFSLSAYQELKKILQFKSVDFSDELSRLRMVKDAAEINLIQKAIDISDYAFSEILEGLQSFLSEKEVAWELEKVMREEGAEGLAFETIVASGERSALPHGVASEKNLQMGNLITMDFGCRYRHYCSDMTRTVILGRGNEKQQEVYGVVLEAQKKAIAAIKPGISCRELDAVARGVITERGYGDYFGHGLGHGVGIDVHEYPHLSPKSEDVLQPGMVVTVEPGVYLPNWGGVRIEDMVLITDQGCQIMTQSPKHLIYI